MSFTTAVFFPPRVKSQQKESMFFVSCKMSNYVLKQISILQNAASAPSEQSVPNNYICTSPEVENDSHDLTHCIDNMQVRLAYVALVKLI